VRRRGSHHPASDQEAASLDVEGLVAGYGGGPDVLHEIDLRVDPGEILAVLGRNGAGKTTLLRTISGLMRARGGHVRVGEIELVGLAPYRVACHGIAHVPAGRRVIPGMSVLDNLRLGAYPLAGRGELEAALRDVLQMLPALEEWEGRRAGSLSGGEQQLLVMGRALMSRPKVLLLDEPLTGLSPAYQLDVLAELRKIREAGAAVLLVEQNVHHSLDVADRAVVIDEGTITVRGAAAQLRRDDRVREGYLGVSTVDRPATHA
jgi:branched-chain amino acid transport system ATP-binding protein